MSPPGIVPAKIPPERTEMDTDPREWQKLSTRWKCNEILHSIKRPLSHKIPHSSVRFLQIITYWRVSQKRVYSRSLTISWKFAKSFWILFRFFSNWMYTDNAFAQPQNTYKAFVVFRKSFILIAMYGKKMQEDKTGKISNKNDWR